MTQSSVSDGVHFDRAVWSAKFEPQEALAAYQKWLKSRRRVNLDRAVTLALPGIRGRIYYRMMHRPVVRPGDIATEASYRVFEAMRRGRLSTEPSSFRRDLKRIVYNSARKVTQFLRPEKTAYGIDFYREAQSHTEAVEYKIFIERDLPRLLARYVIDRLRFDGRRREACLYILDRLLRRVVVGRDTISREFGQPDPDFLCDYIIVMLRRGLYEYREDICRRNVMGDWYDHFRTFMPTAWMERECLD